jgi:hypothetical protein
VGGLRLENATRGALGIGVRDGDGAVQIEGSVQGGLMFGNRGYTSGDLGAGRVKRPHVGAQVSLVLFRWLVVSGADYATRLVVDIVPSGGGSPISSETRWSRLRVVQLGVRMPLGAR